MHGEEAHGMKELSEELEEEKQAIQEMSFASLELRQEGTKKKNLEKCLIVFCSLTSQNWRWLS